MSARFYQFGPFQIDKVNHVLLRDGAPLPLKPKVFDTLLLLVENRGRVLDKDELLSRLWPDTVVEESNLSQNVYLLRKVLGEEPQGEAYIQTMPKRGYRFVASVNEVEDACTDLPPKADFRPHLFIEGKHQTKDSAGFVAEAEQVMRKEVPAANWWRRQGWSSRRGAMWVAGFLLAFGVAAAFYVRITSKSESAASGSAVKSIAVLPFKPLGSDREDENLGFGMADTLITRLSNIKQLVVRPTSAVRKYTSPDQDPATAGRELKVEAVLEGSLQRDGDRVRVTLRLVKASDGSALWAGTFDEWADDFLAVQDRIADKVARTLVPRMTGEERERVARRYTDDAEAYRLYSLGRFHWSKISKEDWPKAVDYFNRAIERDPDYALAYAGLADAYTSIMTVSFLPTAEAMPKAKQAAATALRLDDTLAEAHVSSGRVKAYYEWDWTGAEREFQRAIELSPNLAGAHSEYGNFLTVVGRSEQAIVEAKQARELDPLTHVNHYHLAWALISARRYDEAIGECQKVLVTFPQAHDWMGRAYIGKGMYDEAIAEFERKLSLAKDEPLTTKSFLGYAYGISGRRVQAEKILAELEAPSERRQSLAYYSAGVYVGLGQKDQAFARLEEAYRDHARILPGLRVSPLWDPLRSDPRYADLLRRMGLPQ